MGVVVMEDLLSAVREAINTRKQTIPEHDHQEQGRRRGVTATLMLVDEVRLVPDDQWDLEPGVRDNR